jgi:hypothetical protein
MTNRTSLVKGTTVLENNKMLQRTIIGAHYICSNNIFKYGRTKQWCKIIVIFQKLENGIKKNP